MLLLMLLWLSSVLKFLLHLVADVVAFVLVMLLLLCDLDVSD